MSLEFCLRAHNAPPWGVVTTVVATLLQIALVLLPSSGTSESRVVSGYPFTIDSLAILDDRSAKLSMDGTARIIPRASIDSEIVRHFVNKPGWIESLPPEQLLQFSQRSVQDAVVDPSQLSRAVEAVVALFRHPLVTDSELQGFLVELQTLGPRESLRMLYQNLVLRVIQSGERRAACATSIVLGGFDDLDWVRSRALAEGFRLGPILREVAQQHVERHLHAQQVPAALQHIELLGIVFGRDDSQVQRLRAVSSRVQDLVDEVDRVDPTRLYAMIDVSPQDPIEQRILSPLLTEFLHKKATEAVERNDSAQALGLLSRIQFDWRTPTTHSLILRAVTSLTPSDQTPLVSVVIERSIQRYAAHDPAIRDAYEKFLGAQIKFLLDSQRYREIDYYFGLLRLVRPDPHADNDDIRFALALARARDGEVALGKSILDQAQTEVSLLRWARFYGSGLLADAERLLIVAVAILSTLVLIRVVRSPKVAQFVAALANTPGVAQRRTAPVEDDTDDQRPQGFAYVTKSRPLSPMQQEYLRCLSVLGLSVDSSMADIKSAYRRKIKLTHPDAALEHSPRSSAEFVELTSAYDRLLELRRELGFRDDS